jgi:hypothetical protein
MQIEFSRAADWQLRTLEDEDRVEVNAWCYRLSHWEDDPDVRSRSRLLNVPGYGEIRFLATNTDYRLFFILHADRIEVIDIAHKDTLQKFAQAGYSL